MAPQQKPRKAHRAAPIALHAERLLSGEEEFTNRLFPIGYLQFSRFPLDLIRSQTRFRDVLSFHERFSFQLVLIALWALCFELIALQKFLRALSSLSFQFILIALQLLFALSGIVHLYF